MALRSILCLCALFLYVSAQAQTGITQTTDRNAAVNLSSGADLLTDQVSGTNVNYTATADISIDTTGAWSNDLWWTEGSLSDVVISIQDQDLTVTPPINGNHYVVRFASTHFPDGTALNLKIRATAHLSRTVNGSVVDSTSLSINAYRSITVTNKVLTEITNPADDSDPGNPFNSITGESATGQLVSANVRPVFQSMNHATNPGTLDKEMTLAKRTVDVAAPNTEALETLMGKCTVFFGFTHGEPQGFLDSRGFDSKQDLVDWPAVGQYSVVNRASGIPPNNMAILYSCSTAQAGQTTIMAKFDMPSPPLYTDRAYVGFMDLLSTELMDGDSLALNAEALINKLAAGEPISQAVAEADSEYQPKNASTNLAMNATVFGDQKARLINVYFSASEWNTVTAAQRQNWYYVRETTTQQ